jgi:hypothetical protein
MVVKKTATTTTTAATEGKKRGRKAGITIDKVVVIKRHPIYPQLLQMYNGLGWGLVDPNSNWKVSAYKTSVKIAELITSVSDTPEQIAVVNEAALKDFNAVIWLHSIDENPSSATPSIGCGVLPSEGHDYDDDFEADMAMAGDEDERTLNAD